MDQLVAQVKQLGSTLDDAARRKLRLALRDLAYSMEDDDDIVHRIAYLHLQTAAVRAGIDLKLFEQLSSKSPQTVESLAQATGADPTYLGRLLRFLSSVGMLHEDAKDTFSATNITRALAVKGNQAGICHCFDTCSPQWQAMPKFMKKVGYKHLTDAHNTVFQDAWNTKETAFEWFSHQPDELEFFNQYMAARRNADETWLSVYPVEEESKGWPAEEAVYVNIGGSIGHQCQEFKMKYPNIPGRVILQDLPQTIEHALQTPGVENTTYNFFEAPNPVKGAKFYFLRGVLHDHPDDKVRLILRNTMASMGKDSVILIDEMVLPDTGVDANVASIDLTMMCAGAAEERTEAHWIELFDAVGLKLVKKLVYKPSAYESVMAVVPK